MSIFLKDFVRNIQKGYIFIFFGELKIESKNSHYRTLMEKIETIYFKSQTLRKGIINYRSKRKLYIIK